jgi:hypothetical protein
MVTVGVVEAPSSGIELVLSKNYLPVAKIRVICKYRRHKIKCSPTGNMLVFTNAARLVHYKGQVVLGLPVIHAQKDMLGSSEKSRGISSVHGFQFKSRMVPTAVLCIILKE